MPRPRPEFSATAVVVVCLVAITAGLRVSAADEPEYPHGEFDGDCETCHTDEGWKPAVIDPAWRENDHPFPLRQAHDLPDCRACHPSLDFTGADPDCVTCHLDPHRSELGQDCSQCHVPRTFIDRRRMQRNHHRTRFPLRGSHRALDCEDCHRPDSPGNLQWVNTPVECFACHEQAYLATRAPDHRASGFSTQCDFCHAPSVWQAARFNHDSFFPIYSGRHRNLWSSCSTCHIDPSNFSRFSCFGCHPHSDENATRDAHRGISGFQYDSQACYSCHPRGEADD